MNKQDIWFIINPYAGSQKNASMIQQIIENQLDRTKFIAKIIETKYSGHASEISQEAIKQGIRYVVAVGGDGTVNEVAKVLFGTSTTLGILPTGSGNGLARELGISMNPKKSIETLNQCSITQIDVGFVNDIPFFCTAGIGFDAHCANIFAKNSNKRGFWNYIKIGFHQFWKYQALPVSFAGNDIKIFSMTFANARQFGNNAYIAPQAHINDGFLDCTLVNPLSMFSVWAVMPKLFTKNIYTSPYVESYRGTKFRVNAEQNFLIHYDGEPLQMNTNELIISVLEKKLNVIF